MARDTEGSPRPKHYDAFVSYSHSADGEFAPALQAGMQRLAKPWRRRRALEVFRDQTGLAVNPDLWESIVTALDASEWFVLLASPTAAQSHWVGKEIEHCVATKGPARVLIVVTEGSIAWDDATGDFAEDATAVHPALRGLFAAPPRWVDLAWARDETDLTLRNASFRNAVAEIVAPMHGVTKDELVGEDVRQSRRRARAARLAAAGLVALSVTAVAAGVVATANRAEAQRQQQVAREQANVAEQEAAVAVSRELAAVSRQLLDTARSEGLEALAEGDASGLTGEDLAVPRLLAAQAYDFAPTAEAVGALVEAAAGDVLFDGNAGDPVPGDVLVQRPLAAARDAGLVVTEDEAGRVGVADVHTGDHTLLSATAPASLTPDGGLVLSGSGEVIDVATGEVTSTKPLPVPLTLAAFDESGRTAAYVVSSFAGTGSDPGGSEIVVADLPAGTVARVTVQGQVCAKGCVGSGDTPHLAISPDGRWVAVRTGDEVLGLQHTDGTLVRAWSRTLPGPGFVHFVDDTTLQAHDGAAVHTLDAATGEPLAPAAASLLGGRWRVMPDAALVTPGNDCGGVRLVDPTTFGVLARVPVAQTTYETGCDDVDAVWIDGGRAMLLEAQSLCGPGVGPCATVLPADPQGLVDQVCASAGRELTEQEWRRYITAFDPRPTCGDRVGGDGGAGEAVAAAPPSPTVRSRDPGPDTARTPTPTTPSPTPEPTSPAPTGDGDDASGVPTGGEGLALDRAGLGDPAVAIGAPLAGAVEHLTARFGAAAHSGGDIVDFLGGRVKVVGTGEAGESTVAALFVGVADIPTATGLQVGDPGARVQELYPEAIFEPGVNCGGLEDLWVVVSDDPTASPLIIAGVGGQVSAIIVGEFEVC